MDGLQVKRSDIRAIQDMYPRIISHALVELSRPDIHCDHLPGAMFEQAIGKPSSGRTGIQTPQTGYIQAESAESGMQLDTASGDIAIVDSSSDDYGLIKRKHPGRFQRNGPGDKHVPTGYQFTSLLA
jgi:hypothetical protein